VQEIGDAIAIVEGTAKPDRDYYFDTYKPEALRKMLVDAKARVAGVPEPKIGDDWGDHGDDFYMIQEIQATLNTETCPHCAPRPCTGHSMEVWGEINREERARRGRVEMARWAVGIAIIIALLVIKTNWQAIIIAMAAVGEQLQAVSLVNVLRTWAVAAALVGFVMVLWKSRHVPLGQSLPPKKPQYGDLHWAMKLVSPFVLLSIPPLIIGAALASAVRLERPFWMTIGVATAMSAATIWGIFAILNLTGQTGACYSLACFLDPPPCTTYSC
jgi:hypothetical protein